MQRLLEKFKAADHKLKRTRCRKLRIFWICLPGSVKPCRLNQKQWLTYYQGRLLFNSHEWQKP